MFRAAVGHSEDVVSIDAASEMISQCESAMPGEVPAAGILFCSRDHEHEQMLNIILSSFPGIKLIGCNSDGEMSSALGFTEDAATFIAFYPGDVEISVGIGRGLKKDTAAASRAAAEQAMAGMKKKPALCVALSDSFNLSGVSVIEGLKSALGKNFPVFGGFASQAGTYAHTNQFFGCEASHDSIVVMLFSEPIEFSYGLTSGWQPVGQKMQVTKSAGNVVYEIGGAPAIEFYDKYFGVRNDLFGGEFPVMIYESEYSDPYIRAVATFDRTAGTITYGGDIPEGAIIQLAEATRDGIIGGATESLADAVESFKGNRPVALLAFSCGARKNLLGTRTREEYETLKKTLPDVAICGFYTFGEIGMIACMRKSCGAPCESETKFHHSTIVTLLMGEK